ncbi:MULTISPECIES: hypothetical protein [Cysteiniphilum]|nr:MULTISPECIES: hypothetical protein [Cysteiniphilum]
MSREVTNAQKERILYDWKLIAEEDIKLNIVSSNNLTAIGSELAMLRLYRHYHRTENEKYSFGKNQIDNSYYFNLSTTKDTSLSIAQELLFQFQETYIKICKAKNIEPKAEYTGKNADIINSMLDNEPIAKNLRKEIQHILFESKDGLTKK